MSVFSAWRQSVSIMVLGVSLSLFGMGCRSVSVPSLPVLDDPDLATARLSASERVHCWYQQTNITLRWTADDRLVELGLNSVSVSNVAGREDWLPIFHMPVGKIGPARGDPLGEPIRVLGTNVWRGFIDEFIFSLLPDEPNQAIVINTLDMERLLYKSDSGELIRSSIEKKPRSVPIVKVYRIERMEDVLFDRLDEFLLARKIKDTVVLFRTGDDPGLSKPLYIADLTRKKHAFLSFDQYTQGVMAAGFLTDTTKLVHHGFKSTYLEVLNRPFSATARLIHVGGGFVYDLGIDLWHRTVRMPLVTRRADVELTDREGMDLVEWEEWLDRHTLPSHYGEIDLMIDGDQFFPYFMESLVNAEKSIKLRTYLLDRDDTAVRLVDVLRERSKDADVKVMCDGLGTMAAQGVTADTLPGTHKAPGDILRYLEKGSNVGVRSLTNPWFAGDHSKSTVIDDEVAYIGGMNLGREYRWEWHDLMMRVKGDMVQAIEYEFDKTWTHGGVLGDFQYLKYAWVRPDLTHEEKGYPMRLLMTRSFSSNLYKAQKQAIKRSQDYIYIENSYFADMPIITQLCKARKRGVDVRVIIPAEGNNGLMNENNVITINRLLKNGCRVYIYPGMSHVKAAIYDDWACLGSANFDKLSFRINKELNLGTSAPEFVKVLKKELFEKDFEDAVELTKPLPQNFKQIISSLIAGQF